MIPSGIYHDYAPTASQMRGFLGWSGRRQPQSLAAAACYWLQEGKKTWREESQRIAEKLATDWPMRRVCHFPLCFPEDDGRCPSAWSPVLQATCEKNETRQKERF